MRCDFCAFILSFISEYKNKQKTKNKYIHHFFFFEKFGLAILKNFQRFKIYDEIQL
jgi:hypothetical protein